MVNWLLKVQLRAPAARVSLVALLAVTTACAPVQSTRPPVAQSAVDPFLDTLQERTFRFFWESANPRNGLIPDRWPSPSFSSIAAVGFGLSTGRFYGYDHVNFAPLFGHQYSYVWIDPRGIQDAYMREKGIDYFENARRATLSQRAYAIDNPMGWKGYDGDVWGLTASSGPAAVTVTIEGRARQFRRYWARGAALDDIRDDGTIVPTAAGGSIPFAPDVTIAALKAMRDRYGEHVFRAHGFVDAFNPTLGVPVELTRGRIVPGVGWFEDDYLGIDQGPILLMAENHRSALIWNLMKQNPYIVRGLCRAGFSRGWLEGQCRAA